MPAAQPSGFRRVVFHGDPAAGLRALSFPPDERAEARPFQPNWTLHSDEVAVVLFDRSLSMLTVPMKTPCGETIGVLQLLNRQRRAIPDGAVTAFMRVEVVPFDADNEEVARALAAQAAVAVENRRLTESIKLLFDGFVDAAVTAIEQRDPTTSGHSERVALLACGLAQLVDRADSGPFADVRIGRDELRELRYAAVLHDFGKVGVREQVLIKARKLPAGVAALIRSRIDQAILSAAAEMWERAAREGWSDKSRWPRIWPSGSLSSNAPGRWSPRPTSRR